jgi:hypothetical protein
MAELPSGTVTFLFTDMEGSSDLLDRLGEEYEKVLVAHREMLKQAFEASGGTVVDTQGDSFFVAFARATEAVAGAVSAQRALVTYGWPPGGQPRVRMGIHTGEASSVDQGSGSQRRANLRRWARRPDSPLPNDTRHRRGSSPFGSSSPRSRRARPQGFRSGGVCFPAHDRGTELDISAAQIC